MASQEQVPGTTRRPDATQQDTTPMVAGLELVASEIEAASPPAAWQLRRAEEQLARIAAEAERIESAQLRDDAATDRDDDANARTRLAERVAEIQQAANPTNGPLKEALAANTVLREQARGDRDRAAQDRRHSASQRDQSTAERRQARIELSDTQRRLQTSDTAARDQGSSSDR